MKRKNSQPVNKLPVSDFTEYGRLLISPDGQVKYQAIVPSSGRIYPRISREVK